MRPTSPGSDAPKRPLYLIKWGGGLITDKNESEALRTDVLERLCGELVAGMQRADSAVILGHGSGSFGHWSASESFLDVSTRSIRRPGRAELEIAAKTADAAGRLHRFVIEGLLAAGALPFSWLPSSAIIDDDGGSRPAVEIRPLLGALHSGFLPVTMGDVVLAPTRGPRIWSTERVLESIVSPLAEEGTHTLSRVLWLGNTDGVWDDQEKRIDRIDPADFDRIAGVVGDSGGTDVTGGMRLRFETCQRLSEAGVESWILDGTQEAVLERAIIGERVGGTLVVAGKTPFI